MPRLRCHWALLAQIRPALIERDASLRDVLTEYRSEFFAGGVAPDALRIFTGADKASTHFYDDQRPETWSEVVGTITACHPPVADPSQLGAATRAWMAGYLAHIASDIAYWRNVLRLLPPFPERAGAHHGAWLIADDMAIDVAERRVDPALVRYDGAPPWVDGDAVRRALIRLQDRILVDGMWPVELGYYRGRPEAVGRSDEDLLAELLPAWERDLAESRDLLPGSVWDAFRSDAVRRAADLVVAYLTAVPAAVPPARP